MHVDRQRRGWRVVRQAALLAGDLGQRQPLPAELLRNGDGQITSLAELFEILLEEPVFPVVDRRALVEARQHVVGQDAFRRAARDYRGHFVCSRVRTDAASLERVRDGAMRRSTQSRYSKAHGWVKLKSGCLEVKVVGRGVAAAIVTST